MNLCLVPAENRIKIVPSERLNGRLDVLSLLQSGTAQAGAASSLTLNTLASALQDVYSGLGATVQITSGTGAGQERNVVSSRKNLLRFSQGFGNAVVWTNYRCTVSLNSATAPDGTTTAAKIIDDLTASNTHRNAQNGSLCATGLVTFSAYVKAAEYSFAQIDVSDNISGDIFVMINLSTGALTALGKSGTWGVPTATSTDVGNGWWRITITAMKNSGSNANINVASSNSSTTPVHNGNGTSGIYAWGYQLELGLVATPYIHTEANAAVGVAVDVPWTTQPDATSNYLLQLLTSASRRSRVPAENRLYMVH